LAQMPKACRGKKGLKHRHKIQKNICARQGVVLGKNLWEFRTGKKGYRQRGGGTQKD